MNIDDIAFKLSLKAKDGVFIYLPSIYLKYKVLLQFELKRLGIEDIYFFEIDTAREKSLIDYLDLENIYKYLLFDYSIFNKYAKLGYKFILFNFDRYELYNDLDKDKIEHTLEHIEHTREEYNNIKNNGNLLFYEIKL